MINNTIENKIENILIFIKLFKRLLKIMIFNKKNKISFNKLLLLADKEYQNGSNTRRTLNSFEKVASKDIHKKIALNYKLYKNKKTFISKIKYAKILLYWITRLDETKIIRNYPIFSSNLNDSLRLVFEERLGKIQNQDGQIEEDIRALEDVPALLVIYLEAQNHLQIQLVN